MQTIASSYQMHIIIQIVTELLSPSETSVNVSDEMDISTPPISPIPHISDTTPHAAVTPFKPTKYKNKGMVLDESKTCDC